MQSTTVSIWWSVSAAVSRHRCKAAWTSGWRRKASTDNKSAMLWNNIHLAFTSNGVIRSIVEECSLHFWMHVKKWAAIWDLCWTRLGQEEWIQRKRTVHSRWHICNFQAKICLEVAVPITKEPSVSWGMIESNTCRRQAVPWRKDPSFSLWWKSSRGNLSLSKSAKREPFALGITAVNVTNCWGSEKAIPSRDTRISVDHH